MRYADLFAGMGGMSLALEHLCHLRSLTAERVFTSEIKPSAVLSVKANLDEGTEPLDITTVKSFPRCDILLAGFPCQAFSQAGKRKGFDDTRGTLFFDVLRALDDAKPSLFLLENVEGLMTHDKGRTMEVIYRSLVSEGYKVSFKVLDCSMFGVPQTRRRVFIAGSRFREPDLESPFTIISVNNGDILEKGVPSEPTPFISRLLSLYTVDELKGKCINDKRGGKDNIHSWERGLKGAVSEDGKALLDAFPLERRKRKYAEESGVEWRDGMPLTISQMESFYEGKEPLKEVVDDLTAKGYLFPKGGGYTIATARVGWEINRILDPDGKCVTLTATDMSHVGVADGDTIRRMTAREGLRMFGYSEWYDLTSVERKYGMGKVYDLLGNTVVVPAVEAVLGRLLDTL